eukprot:NODE_3806_length_895_cov_101.994792_g3653_i0.p1 GENE.NODE_3806_length_895_cov_101.994792_g3653_i0~~NODE_3806_length_895_cov_101.994792_g3653_i0.p1  ORF type:complete len:264 (+),score=37.52 NODE_3806_length_895_cov_101.994792_g3653_i0:60-851(+)
MVMSLWTSSPPFAVRSAHFEKFPVHSKSPLWGEAADERVAVLSLCSAISLMSNGRSETLAALTALCSKLRPALSCADCLCELGLAALFPEVLLLLNAPAPVANPSTSCAGYFALMTAYHQVHSLLMSISHDTNESNSQKYVAHQIVLLHQSLSKCGNGLDAFKKEVETNFDFLKREIVETANCTMASPSAKHWLNSFISRLNAHLIASPNPTADPPPNLSTLHSFLCPPAPAPAPSTQHPMPQHTRAGSGVDFFDALQSATPF